MVMVKVVFGHIDFIGVMVDSQELRYAHEELLKQKTALQGRLQDRDSEIERLRNQVLLPNSWGYSMLHVDRVVNVHIKWLMFTQSG